MSSSNNNITNKPDNEINNNNNNNNNDNNNNNYDYYDYYDDFYNYDEQNQNQNQNNPPQNMWNDYGPWYPPMWGFFNHHWFGFEGDHEHHRGRGRGRGHHHHSPSPHHPHEKETDKGKIEGGHERGGHHHRNPPPPEWFDQNFGERGRGRPPHMRGFIPPPFFRGGRGRGRGWFHHPPPFGPPGFGMPHQSFWNHFRKNLKVGEKCPCCGQKIEKLEDIKEDEMKTPFPFMNKDDKNNEKK